MHRKYSEIEKPLELLWCLSAFQGAARVCSTMATLACNGSDLKNYAQLNRSGGNTSGTHGRGRKPCMQSRLPVLASRTPDLSSRVCLEALTVSHSLRIYSWHGCSVRRRRALQSLRGTSASAWTPRRGPGSQDLRVSHT